MREVILILLHLFIYLNFIISFILLCKLILKEYLFLTYFPIKIAIYFIAIQLQ